ncbi:S41 family peptidase [Comamonas sp. JC664]|uniref:S41 family peptidase n=1 Tax=Comamonas sp. JC664 TaxID=2801917 RepID=UPI00191C914E|nr:hypothetical protein [Comamonas sp. JC664]GHG65569.1 hypothetical protein GCM10012319_06820 [Comamonas sp. KCTC 72670]
MALSEAHALLRFFSPGRGSRAIDSVLATAMEGSTVDWDGVAQAHADEFQSACIHEPRDATSLFPVQVERHDTVALIRPGVGEPILPEGTRAVAIDLRGLPDVPELEAALTRAIALSSNTPAPRVSARVRVHTGPTNELYALSFYSNTTQRLNEPAYPASGTEALPVALLTDGRLPPAAARFVADLRATRRAWLWGDALATAVAESRWVPVARKGLSIRISQLEDDAGPLPDRIPADGALPIPLSEGLRELPTLGTPPPLDRSAEVLREKMTPRAFVSGPGTHRAPTAGIARAALVIVHGAVRRFFPYFPVVGDGIDARLEETLASVDEAPVNALRTVQLLRRFGAVLQDGHVFVEATPSPFIGTIPVLMEEVANGDVVVRRSLFPEFRPGDTLVRVDHRSAVEWYAEELTRTSAATQGYRHELATRRLRELSGPRSLALRGPDGHERTVEGRPWTGGDFSEALGSAPSRRPGGWLSDLGAPSLYYVNMNRDSGMDLNAYVQHIQTASDARGLVVDMRHYPDFLAHVPVQHLIQDDFASPILRVMRWTGPDQHDVKEDQHVFTGGAEPSFRGPIALLVGPRTVSRAEHFATMLVGAHRVRVVGRRSAGTNGDITHLVLPGNFRFAFTGMEVLYPDRSTFHGVGIVPDEEIVPTTEDLALDRDPELLKAIELLQAAE